MSNVVSLEQYRSETRRTPEEAAGKAAAQLSTMSYDALLDWAGFDFDRLLADGATVHYATRFHKVGERLEAGIWETAGRPHQRAMINNPAFTDLAKKSLVVFDESHFATDSGWHFLLAALVGTERPVDVVKPDDPRLKAVVFVVVTAQLLGK